MHVWAFARSRAQSGSARAIAGSSEDADAKERLADHVVELTGFLAARYGGLDRAFDWIAEGKTMTLKLFRELVARAKELQPRINISAGDCVVLFELMAPAPCGVTQQAFADFFAVEVGEGRPGSQLRESELDARNRKLARWTKLQLARQGLADEEELNKKQMLGVVKVMREAQKAQKITEFLFRSSTSEVSVTLGFGELHYFQHTIRNPHIENRFVDIRVDDPEVSVVTDAQEWRELHRMFGDGPCGEELLDSPIERSEDDRSLFHVHVAGRKSIQIAFAVRCLQIKDDDSATAASAGSMEAQGWTIEGSRQVPEPRTVLVAVSLPRGVGGDDEQLEGLSIKLQYRAAVVDRTFHFYHGHHQDFRKRIMVARCPPAQGRTERGRGGSGREGGARRRERAAWRACISRGEVTGGGGRWTGTTPGQAGGLGAARRGPAGRC